jgi:hypothetical protein
MKLPYGQGMFIRRCDGPLLGAIVDLFPFLKERLNIDWVGLEVMDGMIEKNGSAKLDIFMKHAKNNKIPVWFQHTFAGSDPNEGNKIVNRYKKWLPEGIILRVKSEADQRSIASVTKWYGLVRAQLGGVSIGCMAPQIAKHPTIAYAIGQADFGLPLMSLDNDFDIKGQVVASIAAWQGYTKKPLIPVTYIFKDDVYENKPKNVALFHDIVMGASDIEGMGYWLYDPIPPSSGLDAAESVDMKQMLMRLKWTPDPFSPPIVVEPPVVIPPVVPPEPITGFKLAIDVSHWDDKLDYGVLADNGVELAVMKIGYANSWGCWKDSRLDQHMAGFRRVGVDTGGFWWNDPTYNWLKQLDACMKMIDQYLAGLKIISADIEQSQGNLWIQRKNKKPVLGWGKLNPNQISDAGYYMMNGFEKRVDIEPITYTRTSFVNEFSPTMAAWLKLWGIWLAAYPSSRVITCDKAEAVAKGFTYCPTWKEYFEKYAPKPTMPIALPKGITKWKIWQFSGDRVKLPGSGSYMDLNWIRG